MNKLLKSVIACVIAAAVGGQLGPMTIGLFYTLQRSTYPHFRLDPMGAMLGLVFAGVPMLVIGIPAQAVLQKFRLTDYFSNTGLATICGAPLAYYLALSTDSLTAFMLVGTWTAFLVGSIAWLIRRPDKDATP
jgi:hypothetical protein